MKCFTLVLTGLTVLLSLCSFSRAFLPSTSTPFGKPLQKQTMTQMESTDLAGKNPFYIAHHDHFLSTTSNQINTSRNGCVRRVIY
jgi:hypothetical protein